MRTAVHIDDIIEVNTTHVHYVFRALENVKAGTKTVKGVIIEVIYNNHRNNEIQVGAEFNFGLGEDVATKRPKDPVNQLLVAIGKYEQRL